ncbi:glycosyltransferase family 4 protein [Candidatus Auribacterota bacterium]
MKIAIDAFEGNMSDRTGPGAYVYNLIKALSSIDNSNEYSLFCAEPVSEGLRDLPDNFKVNSFRVPVNRTLWSQVILPLALRGKEYDVAHIPGHRTPVFKGRGTVATIFDLAYLHFKDYFKRAHYCRLKYFTEITLKNADRVIAISDFTKNDIIENYKISPEKIDVVHLGVDSHFADTTGGGELDKVKQRYSITNKYLIHVGSLQPRKNISRLIRVFEEINKGRAEGLQLVLAGKKGWMYDEIFTIIGDLGLMDDVLVLEYVKMEDLPALIKGAEALVLPSLYEGFGLPVIEGFACGTPVAASNASSLPEVGGDAAVYFDPYSEDDMRSVIKTILEDVSLRNDLKQKGMERAKQFSWEKTAQETLDTYGRIVK